MSAISSVTGLDCKMSRNRLPYALCESYLKKLLAESIEPDLSMRKEIAERFGVDHKWIYRVIYGIHNPGHWRKYSARNQVQAENARAKKLGIPGEILESEWIALCDHHGNICLCCLQQARLVIDHVLPLSTGGINRIDNVQPLCFTCNAKKGARHIDYR